MNMFYAILDWHSAPFARILPLESTHLAWRMPKDYNNQQRATEDRERRNDVGLHIIKSDQQLRIWLELEHEALLSSWYIHRVYIREQFAMPSSMSACSRCGLSEADCH